MRREASVAVDPNFVPYGAPVWLRLDRPEANGLWIAQDTGGAIRGPQRADIFFGPGDEAGEARLRAQQRAQDAAGVVRLQPALIVIASLGEAARRVQ